MTTAEMSKVDELAAKLAGATKALDEAMAQATNDTMAIMAVQPVDFTKLFAIGARTVPMQNVVDSLTRQLEAARAADKFESTVSLRQPMLDKIRSIVTQRPSVPVVRLRGHVIIGDEGAVVKLGATLDTIDLSDIEQAIASSIDYEAFIAAGFTAMVVDVTNFNDATTGTSIKVSPADAEEIKAGVSATKTARAATSGGTRQRKEFEFPVGSGNWLGTREFLTAVESSGHAIATTKADDFADSLRGDGKGISSLASTVASKIGVTERAKVSE